MTAADDRGTTRPSDAGAGAVVLCLDDDEASLALVRAALRHRPGVTVVATATGSEALEALARHRVALALVSVRIGDLSGLTVVEAARRLDPATATVFVALTTDSPLSTGAAAQLAAAGVDGHLVKPLDLDDLFRVVDRAVGR